jgi:lysophospholipase L1-like esterase
MRTWRLWARVAVLVVALAAGGSARAAGDDFFFKPKDRILFLGDSITEQYDYTNLLEYYLTTRFPDWNLTFLNAGIGGDTAGGGLNRADRDVLSEKPTAVTINFGMNDGGYRAPDDAIYKSYIDNQTNLVKKLTAAKVRVALMATSPVEARQRKGDETYNETLGKFCEGLKEVASANGATHVDQFHPSLKVMQKTAADKTPFVCFPDSVHTNSLGGLLMAHSILTAMKAPAVVSDAALEAGGKVTATERCKVTDVKASGGGVTFTRQDEALPMVLSKDQKALLPYLDNLDDLNRYGLKVSGLDKAAKYEVKIDGKTVATVTGEELGKGVNLGNDDLGPITAQSAATWQALVDKNKVLKWRFDTFRRNGGPSVLTDAEKKDFAPLGEKDVAFLDRVLVDRQAKVYELAKPKPHQCEVSPAK